RFPGRVINLHPALPGQYPGTDAIARAYAASRRGEIAATGIMVHHVVPELDAGPVLATAAVPIYPADSLEELEARVHATEHRLLVQVIGRLAGEPAPARESENKPHQDRRGDSAMVTPLGRIAVQKDQAAIELARRYPQSVETVWAALTEPAQLAAWFGPVTLEPRAGGTIVVEAGPASVPVAVRRSVGQILAWEPPRLLEYEWRQAIIEASTLRYELAPDGDGTLLRLTHRWLSLPSAKGFIPGQHANLDRLAAHLAGEPIPDWQQRFNEVAPAYAGAVVDG
ncbi:MAG TPA: formyltransferase family protein, partial [Anaerolineae bacterium]